MGKSPKKQTIAPGLPEVDREGEVEVGILHPTRMKPALLSQEELNTLFANLPNVGIVTFSERLPFEYVDESLDRKPGVVTFVSATSNA